MLRSEKNEKSFRIALKDVVKEEKSSEKRFVVGDALIYEMSFWDLKVRRRGRGEGESRGEGGESGEGLVGTGKVN